MKKIFLALLVISAMCSTSYSAEKSSRLLGHALKPGDCIGILAPGSWLDSGDLDETITLLRYQGYRVKLAPSTSAVYGFFAGTDRKRAEDINNFFRDKSVKAILCARGGYGSARVLDKLDYEMISRNPKPLIGYSDITALHTALGEKSGIATIHGPMAVSFGNEKYDTQYTRQQLTDGLKRDIPIGEIKMPEGRKLETVIIGKAEGVIMGGNLTVIASLVGTPYELDGTGALLLLEDVGEKPYRIDRMLNQLYQSGLLKRVNGILLGDFVNCESTAPYGPNNPSVDDVLLYYAKLSRKPVIKGVPSGHGEYNAFIPFGVRARMKANADDTASLVIEGSVFSDE